MMVPGHPVLQSMFTDIRIGNIALKNVNKIQDGTDDAIRMT